MEESENREAHSRGLFAHQNVKLWWSTLNQWMDGEGAKAHSAVKPLLYHLYAFTWMNLHLSIQLKFDANSKHSLTVRAQSPMLSPFAT
jgi:hypothetical protein